MIMTEQVYTLISREVLDVCTYMYIPTHTFCTVVEPHTMYETCQSGLNCNVVHLVVCYSGAPLPGKGLMWLHYLDSNNRKFVNLE